MEVYPSFLPETGKRKNGKQPALPTLPHRSTPRSSRRSEPPPMQLHGGHPEWMNEGQAACETAEG
jgi:hypothetical protein